MYELLLGGRSSQGKPGTCLSVPLLSSVGEGQEGARLTQSCAFLTSNHCNESCT